MPRVRKGPGPKRIRAGSTKGQPKAKGKGSGKKHEKYMTGGTKGSYSNKRGY